MRFSKRFKRDCPAGKNREGEQVILGILEYQLLVAIFFTHDGHYLRYDFGTVPIDDVSSGLAEKEQVHRSMEYDRYLYSIEVMSMALPKFLQYLGVTAGDILVHHFCFPDWEIGTTEWASFRHDTIQQYERLSLVEQESFDNKIAEWEKQERWVLNWRKEYLMTSDGEIGDT